MTTEQVAKRLVELCRQGQFESAIKELYSKDIISIEPEGAPVKESRGIEAIIAKNQQFAEMVQEIHGMEVSDPLVADDYFAVTMKLDVTYKGAPRSNMNEVCVYQVKDGKIAREQFFHTPMMAPAQA
ncbi:MAG: nuclear transport factor 2 family protein [Flavobacteriales bacterium]|nr:nuclear transport factor 2 family protein [Flavobacteriales bacterium]MCB9448137.1 nuclear transport factor 2 family protein [Flavobacteriales bacterium]